MTQTNDLEALRAIIDSATDAALPPVCDTTGNGNQLRAQIQCDIAANILAAVRDLRPAGVGEAVAWPENLDWSMVDSGALCHWRASFGDYILDVVHGHDKTWSYRVNNTGRMNFDGLESATAAAMEDLVGRLKRRWAQAKETMRLYATPAHPDDALMERVRELEATGYNWIIGKGQMSRDEPLYGCQILDGTTEIACGECSTIENAISAALSDLKAGAGR